MQSWYSKVALGGQSASDSCLADCGLSKPQGDESQNLVVSCPPQSSDSESTVLKVLKLSVKSSQLTTPAQFEWRT